MAIHNRGLLGACDDGWDAHDPSGVVVLVVVAPHPYIPFTAFSHRFLFLFVQGKRL
jgi:hypothetical protein